MVAVKELQRVTVTGAIDGGSVIAQGRTDGTVLLRPATYPSVFARPAGRPASEAEIAALQDEHGAFLSPDGGG